MRYYIKIHRKLDEPYGVNGNFDSKSYYLCQVIDAPTIPRNIPRKKKREKVEYMMENYELKLTDNDIELEEEEHVFVTEKEINDRQCYNIIVGGYGATGKVTGEETKEKLRQQNLGKVLTKEHCMKISQSNKGRQPTDETRAKWSAVRKGRKLSEETKKKIGLASTGRKHTDETKEKLSAKRIGEKNPLAKAIVVDGRYFPTRQAAADFFGVSPCTVRRWAEANKHGSYFPDKDEE